MKATACFGALVVPCIALLGLDLSLFEKPAPQAAAAYAVNVERNVQVRMRDGVCLATDVYVPTRNGEPLKEKVPAVLVRTPYGKAGFQKQSTFFAEHGYLAVAQDCRGRHGSAGDYFPYVNEPKDGYDTIVWLSKHPACNGKVGMYGGSDMADNQLAAAGQRPPGLVTIIPHQCDINDYHYSSHMGGAVHLGLLRWALMQASTSQEARNDAVRLKALETMRGRKEFLLWASRLPWKRGQTPLSHLPRYEDIIARFFFENTDYNDFWRQPGLAYDESFADYPADMPILWIGGWFDWYPRSISDGYQKMVSLKKKNQYLLMGPWTHGNFSPNCGEVNFASGKRDLLQMELAWFHCWLRNDRAAWTDKPVNVFVMGGGDGKGAQGRLNHGGHWHAGDRWPPANTRPTRFYLHPHGKLSPEKPTTAGASTSYTYDPRNTVSSNGRCFVAYLPHFKQSGIGPWDMIDRETLPGHGSPGMPTASRLDVLVFQTPPLEKKVTIAGNVRIDLYASSDAPDTDFFVKLIDVYPPSADYPLGFALPLCDGVLRARYRNGFTKPALMKSGEAYRLEFPLEPTANLFQAGHRIRVEICSSNFPMYDINRNTGDPADARWRLANNSIWHDPDHPSAILLPQEIP